MVVEEQAMDPLELRLGSLGYGLTVSRSGADDTGFEDSAMQLLDEQRRQITIIYNGRMSVCDVTNFQASAILDMAKNEMENKKEDKMAMARQTVELEPGLSMKRSLQRFLERRKARMAEHSFPCGANRNPLQLF